MWGGLKTEFIAKIRICPPNNQIEKQTTSEISLANSKGQGQQGEEIGEIEGDLILGGTEEESGEGLSEDSQRI